MIDCARLLGNGEQRGRSIYESKSIYWEHFLSPARLGTDCAHREGAAATPSGAGFQERLGLGHHRLPGAGHPGIHPFR